MQRSKKKTKHLSTGTVVLSSYWQQKCTAACACAPIAVATDGCCLSKDWFHAISGNVSLFFKAYFGIKLFIVALNSSKCSFTMVFVQD